MAAPVRVLARLLRRNQSMGGGNDPAVAPAHDRFNSPDAGNRVAARGHPNSVGALEHRGSVPNLDNGPPGNGCRPRFRRGRQRRLRRHRHRGRTRTGLGGENRARWIRRQASPGKRRKAWECFRPWRVPRFASLTRMPSFGRLPILPPDLASAMAGEGASFCAIWSTPSRFATSGQFSAAGPSQCKACRQRHRGEQDGARAIAVWLTQHQDVIAIAAQDIRQARRLSSATTRCDQG